MAKTTCRGCKNRDTENNCCTEEIWDRNNLDETWLLDDSDFEIYLDKDRFCTEYQPVTPK